MKIWWFWCKQYWNNDISDRTCNYRCNESILIKQKGHLYRYGSISTWSINNNDILIRFDSEFWYGNYGIFRQKGCIFSDCLALYPHWQMCTHTADGQSQEAPQRVGAS
jgi:hypothetical protein